MEKFKCHSIFSSLYTSAINVPINIGILWKILSVFLSSFDDKW